MEAWNFGAMELLVLCVIVLSLLATVKDGGVAILAGDELCVEVRFWP